MHYIAYSMNLLNGVGSIVRELREDAGMTRQVLSEQTGISVRFLAQLEAGEGNISLLRLAEVAARLGSSAGELVSDAETRLRARERGPMVALLGLRGAGKSTIGPKLAT